jgi:hypothetical protein
MFFMISISNHYIKSIYLFHYNCFHKFAQSLEACLFFAALNNISIRKMNSSIKATLLTILSAGSLSAATFYVDIDATGNNDGTSWTNAYTDLQSALNAASSGDDIWLAEGTYYPSVEVDVDNSGGSNVREVTFQIPNGVSLYGGFDGSESLLSDRNYFLHTSTLSGDIGVQGDSSDNAYHVIFTEDVSSSTVVDGVTITEGYADLLAGNNKNYHGAGWMNTTTGATLSSPTLTNVTFSNNHAAAWGGGMANYVQNGGTCQSVYTNCTFTNNIGPWGGGAIWNTGYSNGTADITAINCLFIHNGGGGNGGAINNDGRLNAQSNATIINCTFYDNDAQQGGAIYNDAASNGTSNATVKNSIFWSNVGGGNSFYNANTSTTTVSYTLLNEATTGVGTTAGLNMIYNTNPLFVNEAIDNFVLSSLSPAIDTGDNSSNVLSFDLYGNNRIINGTINLGPFEADLCFATASSISITECDSVVSPSGNHVWTSTAIYNDTVMNAAGCDSIITADIVILNSSNTPLTISSCGSYVSPSGLYTWTTTGIYSDTLTNTLGCDSIILIDLTINNASNTAITLNACESYTSASGNHTWTNSGTYTDTLVNNVGCDSVLTYNLTINNVNVNVLQLGDTLMAEATGASYQWLNCLNGLSVLSGEISQTFVAAENGEFAVEIIESGCIDTSDCIVMNSVGIKAPTTINTQVFPNPNKGSFTIDLGNQIAAEIAISDLNGKAVYSLQNKTGVLAIQSDLTAGVYVISIKTKDSISFAKLMID